MAKAETRTAERSRLAASIANVTQVEGDLRAARDAADKASDRVWSAQARLAELRERPDNSHADTAAAFLAAMNEGRDAGVAELEAPAKARETEKSEIEREIEALSIARRVFDDAVKEGENFVWLAQRRLTDAVAEVMRAEADIAGLIAKAEAAQVEAIAHRSALLQLERLLPPGEERSSITKFLLRPLESANFASHPAARAISAAFEDLSKDADAPLPA